MKNLNSKRIDAINLRIVYFVLPLLFLSNGATAQKLTSDISYVENGHKCQVLDIYTPEEPTGKPLPVMFWIHGGGWQVGDKSDVALKSKVLTERGFVFVSTNYRLLPELKMEELIGDVAKSLGWVHKNIAAYGGDDEQRRGQNVTRHRIKTNLLAEAVAMSMLVFPIPEILTQGAYGSKIYSYPELWLHDTI